MPVYKLCTRCETLKEVTEFGKNSSRVDGLFIYCKLCVNSYNASRADSLKAWRIANRDRLSKNDKQYYLENCEVIKARAAKWQRENQDRYRDKARIRRANNLDRFRKYARDWVRNNPGKANEALARRRVAEFKATPKWIDRKAVRKIYVDAARLTRETGIPHAVDHIVPLRSKIVCGLHWEGNLQIITKSENSMKSNRHWPDMP